MRSLRALLPACIAALAFAAPASAVTLQDAVMSKNVEYLGSIQQDVGLTTGAKVIGDRLFVTSGKNISIYDISDPATPKPLGGMKLNVAWENEEVPTNGKVLAVASDFYSVGVPECVAAMAPDGCVQFFDVRDPANIKQVGTIPIANHTAECALDCQYFYGKAGTIIDARGILDGTPPKVIGNWIDELRAQGVDEQSCHHIREIRPGVLLTACQPFAAISINAEDGGSPDAPEGPLHRRRREVRALRALAARGRRQVRADRRRGELHRALRAQQQRVLASTAPSRCWPGQSKTFEGPLAQVPPAGNGVYADGKPVAGALGCSVHWFQEHPTFHDGGLVALSEYEDGVRFLQIKPDGSIEEQGYFLSLGSSSSSPKWAGKDDVLYSIDYQRGIDILRWTGRALRAGRTAGERPRPGARTARRRRPRPTPRRSRSATALAQRLRPTGWSPGLCYLGCTAHLVVL